MQQQPNDSSETFEERGQEVQDQEDLDAGRIPSEAELRTLEQTQLANSSKAKT